MNLKKIVYLSNFMYYYEKYFILGVLFQFLDVWFSCGGEV